MPQKDSIPPKRKAGRPKGSLGKAAEARRMTVKEYAMTHVYDAIDVFARVMKDSAQPASAQVAAAGNILDRAIGRATQPVEHTGKDGGPIETRRLDNAPPEVLEWLAGQEPEERTVQ